ncbi:DNA polymerase III subunit chi [Francisellaceae bacterium CB300]
MKVEFQVFQTSNLVDVLNSICEYLVANYSHSKRIAILAPQGIAKELDSKLWQADTESFLPHFCAINSKQYNSCKDIPLLITDNLFIVSEADELINLMDIVIDSSKVKVAKLTEIVYQVDKVLESSRKKYMFYKKAGFEIESNKK